MIKSLILVFGSLAWIFTPGLAYADGGTSVSFEVIVPPKCESPSVQFGMVCESWLVDTVTGTVVGGL